MSERDWQNTGLRDFLFCWAPGTGWSAGLRIARVLFVEDGLVIGMLCLCCGESQK